MKNKYGHLLSPLTVGGRILKNRLESTNSVPHFMQGPEPYPSQALIHHLAERAKNGAAIVTMSGITCPYGLKELPKPPGDLGDIDIIHFPAIDAYDPKCQNYLIQLADAIHYYGSLACMNLQFPILPGYGVSADPQRGEKEFTEEMVEEGINAYVEQAKLVQHLGYDMCSIQFSYGLPFGGQFLNPRYNHRTDRFGGSLENRAYVIVEIFRRIRQTCGPSFLTEGVFTAEDLPYFTLDDMARVMELCAGNLDIVQLRMATGDDSHPTGFLSEATPVLAYSEALMKRKPEHMLLAPVGGFQDPDVMEDAISTGKADLIAAARAFICDPEFGLKLAQGRGEDIVPCIRCNKCHVISEHAPFLCGCSVNPVFGIEHVLSQLVTTPGAPKKVAVIGGGPGGMETALLCRKRGHQVTLFEASGQLGGLLLPAVVPDFKWPLKQFLDYLIAQVQKNAVEVRLNTKATPELIDQEHFDAVVACVGSSPIIPPIPGLTGDNVTLAVDAFLHPEQFSGPTVVLGGGEIGIEAAILLAQNDVPVTVLEMTGQIAREADRPHYFSILMDKLASLESRLTIRTQAKVTEVLADGVVYEDAAGQLHTIACRHVIASLGTRANTEAAVAFYDSAPEFYTVGDCVKAGSLLNVMRSAFSAATRL